MKKSKRILALIGAILLVVLYGSTLIFALLDNSASQGLLKASIACTIALPVFLYAISLVYKNAKKKDNHDDNDDNDSAS